MTYGRAFILSLVLYMVGCVYVVVSDDKTKTHEAPLIETTSEDEKNAP